MSVVAYGWNVELTGHAAFARYAWDPISLPGVAGLNVYFERLDVESTYSDLLISLDIGLTRLAHSVPASAFNRLGVTGGQWLMNGDDAPTQAQAADPTAAPPLRCCVNVALSRFASAQHRNDTMRASLTCVMRLESSLSYNGPLGVERWR